MARLELCVATTILIAGIATPTFGHEEIPAKWGAPTATRAAGSDCPEVAGRYLLQPSDRIAQIERGPIEDGGADIGRMLFRHPRIRDKGIRKEILFESDKEADESYFEILQSADKFELRRTFVSGKGLGVYLFDRARGDFDCKNGFIVLSPIVINAPGHYSKNSSMFTKGQDGSLVYQNKIEAHGREMLILSSSKLGYFWYRFPEITRNRSGYPTNSLLTSNR